MEHQKINKYFKEVRDVLDKIEIEKIKGLVKKINETKETNATIFIAGNGGSASTASHWVCDLMKGTLNDCDSQEKRLKAISLSDSIPTLSAYANDISYDVVFAQQLRNFVEKDDLLIPITGSGRSKNIVNVVKVAKEANAYVFGLLGADGGDVLPLCDNYILIPSKNYGIIEDMHLMIGHIATTCLKGKDNIIS